MRALEPYREQIDALDCQLVTLLAERFAVVQQVAQVKAREGIAPILPERIEEVCAHVEALAAEKGLDPDFVRGLWRAMIEHACALEQAHIDQCQSRCQGGQSDSCEAGAKVAGS